MPPLDAHESLPGMTNAGGCFVVAPGEGRLIDLGEFEMRVEAAAGTTCGVVSVLQVTAPPGVGPPIHVHDDAAEAFYVLEGDVMNLEGDERSSRPAHSSSSPKAFRTGSASARSRAGSSTSLFPQR